MSLSNFLTKTILIMVSLCTLVAFILITILQYNNYLKDIENTKIEYFKNKESDLKKEIMKINNYIDVSIRNNKDFSTEELKNEILIWISTLRYEDDGYIFVNDLEGNALVYDGKKLNTKIPHPNITIYNKQLDLLKNKEDSFLFYNFKKPNVSKTFYKYSYIKKYEKWGWIIGTGIYIDDLNTNLDYKNKEFKKEILESLFLVALSFLVLILLSYFLINKIIKYIDNNIKTLISSFQIASKENKKIQTDNLTYNEFISLANNLNNILEEKNLAEKKLQDYLNMVDENVILSCTNKDGIITSVSNAFCEISGYTSDELVGNSHNVVRHEEMSSEVYQDLWKTIKKGFVWRGEIKNKAKNGTTYWVDAIIQPVYDNGELSGYTALRHNITNKKRIEYLSEIDELTQLYNRRKFNIVIENELNRKKREQTYICLMFLDVDYFKLYNDTYGHQSGDIALAKIAEVLKENTKRIGDYSFRLGGEEFAILVTIDDEIKAYEHATTIKNQIENLKILHSGNKVNECITISIGLICKSALEIRDTAQLYKLADDALYEAKKAGRNCVFIKN